MFRASFRHVLWCEKGDVERVEKTCVDNSLDVRLLLKMSENRVFAAKHPLADFNGLLVSAFVVIIGKRRRLAS